MSKKRLNGLIAAIALVGFGWFLFSKMANRPLPPSERVARIVHLPQGWSPEEAARYHYTSQGTFLLPIAWLQSLEAGFFSSKRLTDPSILGGERFLIDGVTADPKNNPDGLPIGWAVASWPPPSADSIKSSAAAPVSRNVGFTCAACHTSQLNYKGVGIRIEGAGSMIDTDAVQKMVAKAIISTELLPWKRQAFIQGVAHRTGAQPADVGKALDNAFWKSVKGVRDSFFSPLYTDAGYGRMDALQKIANTLMADDLKQPSNNRKGDGPVKFPYLWDIWRLDWVQYNGSVRQPMVRNVGESLGVRAQTNFVDADGKPNSEPSRWSSSVMVPNLFWMEQTLERLKAPAWPADVFPPIDATRAAAGRVLFQAHCASCHGVRVDMSRVPAEWKVTMVPLQTIGTDPKQAENFRDHTYSGEKLGLGQLSGAQALQLVTTQVKNFKYDRQTPPLSPAQRSDWDGYGRENEVRAPAAYKARPLVGVWASPPYLHNGAVSTLYDLLSPERPKSFASGSREYDPVKVGYVIEARTGGVAMDATKPGNSNLGHWFANDARKGRIGPLLSGEERFAIIEYLKSATYADYPCRDAGTGGPLTGEVCGAAPAATSFSPARARTLDGDAIYGRADAPARRDASLAKRARW